MVSLTSVALRELRLRAVRARFAQLASVAASPSALGSIRLQPHQRLAVARVTKAIARDGGCLLADDVGRGKTYVALAVAQHWSRPLVVVPASIRQTWQRAMERARVPCSLVTHESLSRGRMPAMEPDGIIVDESHRFRSLEAKRHATLARISAYAPVLLLSATPLQNGTRDLAAQLALFLGSSAFGRSEGSLARFVIRGAYGVDGIPLPTVAPPIWLHTGQDDGAVLRAILALPAPPRASDTGDAGALRTIGLVRAWASSRAALLASLRQRVRVATAIEQCASDGLTPTRRDLRTWQGTHGDVQLAFASMLIAQADADGGKALLAAVAAERAGLDQLTAALRATPDPDMARVTALRRIRAEHPDARILAFSEFASTVRAYFALLRTDPGVGMLTASEARIASGRLPRGALLARFAPVAQEAREPVARERVGLLLATDLLSEGMNLQDASIVVHLDLPWNPARLAQRLGRVRRPGGAILVRSCVMAPPATTELLLRVEARLRSKLARAERAIGRALDVLPALSSASAAAPGRLASEPAAQGASAEALGMLSDQVTSWRRAGAASNPAHRCDSRRSARARTTAHDPVTRPICAAVASEESGWIVALDDGALIARVGSERPAWDGQLLRRAVTLASGPARPVSDGECIGTLLEVRAWLERERVSRDCGVDEPWSAIDNLLARRIERVVRRVPRHARANSVALATTLRGHLGRPRSLGAERELAKLVVAHADDLHGDAVWLEHSLAVVTRAGGRALPPRVPDVAALIVFALADAGSRVGADLSRREQR